ncbi:unnamed protein product [Onchocerca ochengi]|uniref:Thrombospondin related anonymous protein n=1 Tax=Onchocerca ochengi TaxID=42157 RepID=A0A182EJD8_ONCOC|nr:unnamed protein product [Onchocerca ochengi]
MIIHQRFAENLNKVQGRTHSVEQGVLSNTSRNDLSDCDWSEWNECSHLCGGCGMHNRTLTLPNGTRIVHARHCNLKPCMDNKIPCCEPFIFKIGKCLLMEKIRNDKLKSIDPHNQTNDTITTSDGIKEVEFPNDKILGPVKSDKINAIFNITTGVNVDLNGTRNIDDDQIESSGEIDSEIDRNTSDTEILERSDEKANASRVLKQKAKIQDYGKGYDRKGYKQRQRRYRQRLPATVWKLQNVEKPGESQKVLDSIYEYEYVDYYYVY